MAGKKGPWKDWFDGAFDRLFIWLCTPIQLFLYEHDMLVGVSSSGRATEVYGQTVQFYGSVAAEGWDAALGQISARLDAPSNGCQLLASRPLSELMATFRVPEHFIKRRMCAEVCPCSMQLTEELVSRR